MPEEERFPPSSGQGCLFSTINQQEVFTLVMAKFGALLFPHGQTMRSSSLPKTQEDFPSVKAMRDQGMGFKTPAIVQD
jgi:hypothetical protein